MIGSLQGFSQVDQLADPLNVNSSIQVENTKDDAIRAQLLCHEDIALHDAELVDGIAKITRARPNHYVQTNRDLLTGGGHEPRTRCNSALRQPAAQFHPFCPAALSCDRRFQRIDTYFDNESVFH